MRGIESTQTKFYAIPECPAPEFGIIPGLPSQSGLLKIELLHQFRLDQASVFLAQHFGAFAERRAFTIRDISWLYIYTICFFFNVLLHVKKKWKNITMCCNWLSTFVHGCTLFPGRSILKQRRKIQKSCITLTRCISDFVTIHYKCIVIMQ